MEKKEPIQEQLRRGHGKQQEQPLLLLQPLRVPCCGAGGGGELASRDPCSRRGGGSTCCSLAERNP